MGVSTNSSRSTYGWTGRPPSIDQTLWLKPLGKFSFKSLTFGHLFV